MVSQPLHCLAKAAIRDLAKLSVAWRVSQPQKQHAKVRRIGSSIELLLQGFELHPRLTPEERRAFQVFTSKVSQSVSFTVPPRKVFIFGRGMVIRWAAAGSISAHWWMPTAETPNIYHPLQVQATPRYRSRSKCFKLHALAHIHYIIISQLQLKASLSLHCVPNRGLPFLVEMIVMKTARHEGRCMMNHFAKR